MGTWRIPLALLKNPTGDTVWASGEGGCVVFPPPANGTIQGDFPADSVGIYLDGSGTPIDLGALPSGFTPADAYTFHWRGVAPDSGESVSISIPAISDVITHNGPDGAVPPIEFHEPYTGCTLSTLLAIAGSTITVTMVSVTSITTFANDTNVPPGDTLTWFAGTYSIATIRLPPMPIRTPLMQGGGGARRRG